MAVAMLAFSQPLGASDGMRLPSGQVAQPLDQIWEEDTATLRLRYIVPGLAEPAPLYLADGDRVFRDMQHLCDLAVAEFGPTPPQEQGWRGAIVTLMSAPLDFGQRDPDVVQVFEGFIFTMDGCDWDDGDFHD